MSIWLKASDFKILTFKNNSTLKCNIILIALLTIVLSKQNCVLHTESGDI